MLHISVISTLMLAGSRTRTPNLYPELSVLTLSPRPTTLGRDCRTPSTIKININVGGVQKAHQYIFHHWLTL